MQKTTLSAKYKPEGWGMLAGNEDVTKAVEHLANSEYLVNIMLSGPPGVGKTSRAMFYALKVTGDPNSIIVVNDPSTVSIRGKLTLTEMSGNKRSVVVIPHADILSFNDQVELCLNIDNMRKTTIFLTTSNIYALIPGLISRMCVLSLKPVDEGSGGQYLSRIIDGEGINMHHFNPEILSAIVRYCDGDMRRSVNMLSVLKDTGNVITVSDMEMWGAGSAESVMDTCLIRGDYEAALEIITREEGSPVEFLRGCENYVRNKYRNKELAKYASIQIAEYLKSASMSMAFHSDWRIVLRWFIGKLCLLGDKLRS